MPFLECREVARSFGCALALRPTSFALEEGEHLAITGPSGAGKSTLLSLVAGLLEASAGLVVEDGRCVNMPGRVTPPERRGLGVLLQGLGLWPHLSLLENVEFSIGATSVKGFRARRRERRRLAEQALSQVGLLPLARRKPHEVSGGEKQRVAWARAVAGSPRILILDEPLTSLDPCLQEDLVRLVVDYGSHPGRTVILATHQPQVAIRVGRRQLALLPAQDSVE